MLLPKQIWKDIPGYEGKYQVSNTGKVRSLNYNRTGKVKRLKPTSSKGGYSIVSLWKDGKPKYYLVHRLVALAFIPNLNNLPCVNHKDENPSNNTVWNLEWCTHEYNNNYGRRMEKQIATRAKNKLNMQPVVMLDKNTMKPLKAFYSIAEASVDINKADSNISYCCSGKQKTTGGYKWKYIQVTKL